MVDIIEQFLDAGNVTQVARQYKGGSVRAPSLRVGGDEYNVARMRALMSEFIHGPYGGGIFDVLSGTDPQLYVGQMNSEFLRYLHLRDGRALHVTRDQGRAALDIAQEMGPFSLRESARKRARAIEAKHVPGRTDVSRNRIPRGLDPTREHHPTIGMGPAGDMPVYDAVSCQWVNAPTVRVMSRGEMGIAREMMEDPYAVMRGDLASTVHLMARDDEHGDTGCATVSRAWTDRARCAPGPYDFADTRVDDRLNDPVAGSGEAQYHLIELDSRLAVLNRERTLPIGYGSAQEQLAEEARVASRYSWWRPTEGVIPEAHYKRLTRGITPSGRVTLDDERENARDIFGSDSRGFILSGRR